MAPKASWNKIVTSATRTKNATSPAQGSLARGESPAVLGSPAPAALAKYAQAQEEEIDALKAIYMSDYEEIETKGAWSKSSDKAFRLCIKPLSDVDISVTLSVRLTATYPKTAPLIEIEKSNGVRQKSQKEIEKIVKNKPRELLDQVMIFDIATAIQEILEDALTARQQDAAMPSLEEERAVHEAAAEKLAKEQEQEEMKRKEEEKAEEDRVLKQMVDEEMHRRKEQKRKNKVVATPSTNLLSELESNPMVKAREGTVTEVFTLQATLSPGTVVPLVLKKAVITNFNHEARLKKLIEDFDDTLEDLKRISHENVIGIMDFKIDRVVDRGDWNISILTEYADKGSLTEMFQVTESFSADKVRSWTIELLEALDYLHRNGVIHKRVHPGNILFCQPASGGALFVKLADGGFQQNLHDIKNLSRGSSKLASARSAYWLPSELSQDGNGKPSRKTDIWDLGILFLQMLFGLDTPQKYSSPDNLMESLRLSDPLREMIRKFFKVDPKKRPSAFDLIPSEFLRNDVPVLSEPLVSERTRRHSNTLVPIHDRRIRRESSSYGSVSFVGGPISRYASEWVESGRLGKGGYGEVVKARNKLDGRIYAIKKIKQNSASALTEVLSEVMLLSRLNHPYVVRYYTAWPEDDYSNAIDTETEEDSIVFTEDTVSASALEIEFGRSNTGGLDFISSSGYPKIEFGNDSDEGNVPEDDGDDDDDDEEEEEEEEENFSDEEDEEEENSDEDDISESGTAETKSPLKLKRTMSSAKPRPVKSILYIQMEYCERHTLRDLIRKGLHEDPDEAWRLFRQILEGLAHIHSHGIIHRDLKPDNVFIDVTNNPRIGDFGLATSGQYQIADKAAMTGSMASNVDGDMTRSVGTALYVAPELRSGVGGTYNDKVDMYSLGIIFFEMCYPLRTAMERDHVIRQLREKEHTLPTILSTTEKALQGSIIISLISHKPSERPSSAELLRSGKLPLQIEDETVRLALQGLSDPNSPYYHKMLSALFAQGSNKQVKDFAWDLGQASGLHDQRAADLMLQAMVEERLCAVFRRHGAVKTRRQLLFPRSAYYADQNVVQLFDASGTLVQLPYDFTLPNARTIARHKPAAEKTYTIGQVYRDPYSGGAPRSNGEADFDIISYNSLDLALKEAEVIKVMDEIIDEFPSLASAQICFHINHSDLLELIMEYCRISLPLRRTVKDVLSRLNVQQWPWQKIRNDLRAPTVGVSSTSLDDLAKFDFRDTPEKAFAKLQSLFEGTEYIDKTHAVFAHMRTVVNYAKRFNVRRKLYISPLNSWNEKFYAGGFMFQCLFDTKRRDVLAAGGRYDRLIEEHRPKVQGQFTGCHAVGLSLGWDRLVTTMTRFQRGSSKSNFLKKSPEEHNGGHWTARRCDVLVASFDPATLRSAGVKMVGELWAHHISAELAVDARSLEELLAHYSEDKHCWIIIIKHDAINTGKPDVKVKSLLRKEDTDLRSSELLSYLRQEFRERDHREGITINRALLTRLNSHPDQVPHKSDERKSNVQVLLAQHRSKKSNKWSIVEAAQARTRELLSSYETGPIAAIETKDEILDLIRETRLSDPDSWRRVIQGVPLAERQYLQELLDMLRQYAQVWKNEGAPNEGRMAFVYNFRTGGEIMYDLGL